MYCDMLAALAEIIQRAGDSRLDAAVKEMKAKIEKEHSPEVKIVSGLYGKTAVLEELSKLCKELPLEEKCIQGTDALFCLHVEYGEPGLTSREAFFEDGMAYTEIFCKTKEELFGELSLCFWCGAELSRLDGEALEEGDFLILATNALMALTQQEKEWINEVVKPCFGGGRFAVALYNGNLVNTQEDMESLCQSAKSVLEMVDPKINFFQEVSEAIIGTRMLFGDKETVKEKRQAVIMQNGIERLKKEIQTKRELGNLDIERLKANAEKAKKECREIELAGKFAVESSVENYYGKLRLEILDGADQYGEEIFHNIQKRMESTKEVERDAKNIQPYIEGAWKNFENKVNEKLSFEQEKIMDELQKQIQDDCDALLDLVDTSEAYRGLLLKQGLTQAGAYAVYDENIGWKEKILSKGLLITSFALAFVNPVWGISAFVGTTIYEKYRNNNAQELRRQILENLYEECSKVKKEVVGQLSKVMEEVKEGSKKNVGDVYKEIIENLMEAILASAKEAEALKNRCAILDSIIEQELPLLEKRLYAGTEA